MALRFVPGRIYSQGEVEWMMQGPDIAMRQDEGNRRGQQTTDDRQEDEDKGSVRRTRATDDRQEGMTFSRSIIISGRTRATDDGNRRQAMLHRRCNYR